MQLVVVIDGVIVDGLVHNLLHSIPLGAVGELHHHCGDDEFDAVAAGQHRQISHTQVIGESGEKLENARRQNPLDQIPNRLPSGTFGEVATYYRCEQMFC